MAAQKPLVVNFKDIDKHDLPLVGGKNANLGEMVGAGFPVPGGFAVTVEAYDQFIEENHLSEDINDLLERIHYDKPEDIQRVTAQIRKKIKSSKIPSQVRNETLKSYKKLSGRFKKALVAVRSSATAEDLPGASFAGQQETYLNVKGDNNLMEAIRNGWASLYTARATFYRKENKISHKDVKISMAVQLMVQSDVSGVMFTIDPVTNDKDRIIIEAVWGLGELIVQGSVLPDRYVVQKDTFSLLSKEISDQSVELVRVGNITKEIDVPKKKKDLQKITNEDAVALAKIGDKLQKHYYHPQDIEWAKQGNKLYITQTRPVTTIKEKQAKEKSTETGVRAASTPIVTGISASPGIGSGHVKIVSNPKEIKKINQGDVLVAEMTSPDYVPAMKKASGIVTDKGGLTSHAAIVSRELGVPAIVGTKDATTKLKENNVVTVDGGKGEVYRGSNVKIIKARNVKPEFPKKGLRIRTATKMYVNLAEPQRAREISKYYVDGVGLLRAEFMIADIGIHPKEAIKQKKQKDFVNKLTKKLELFCKSFGNRPVVYRATDFKTNEYRSLPGGKAWEPEESNPMLGFRGALRYKAHPDVFNLELQAIKKVREKYKNLWLMIPFVRSPAELTGVRRLVAAEGLFESTTFKFWLMVEIPVNVILIEDFIKVGIDGISFGSNDLTMLITGTDRDNSEVASAFNQRDPAVYWAFRRVIKACHKHGVTSSICGQAPSVYDDLVEKLVKYGITSISVNPDAAGRVRKVISETEHKIAKGK